MFHKDKIRIEFILEMIDRIDLITKRHGGIVETLNDVEGQMAVLMAIAQIGETLKKIDSTLLAKYDLLEDQKGAYFTRNYIIHDYVGVNLSLIENILRAFLPKLRTTLLQIVKDNDAI